MVVSVSMEVVAALIRGRATSAPAVRKEARIFAGRGGSSGTGWYAWVILRLDIYTCVCAGGEMGLDWVGIVSVSSCWALGGSALLSLRV